MTDSSSRGDREEGWRGQVLSLVCREEREGRNQRGILMQVQGWFCPLTSVCLHPAVSTPLLPSFLLSLPLVLSRQMTKALLDKTFLYACWSAAYVCLVVMSTKCTSIWDHEMLMYWQKENWMYIYYLHKHTHTNRKHTHTHMPQLNVTSQQELISRKRELSMEEKQSSHICIRVSTTAQWICCQLNTIDFRGREKK